MCSAPLDTSWDSDKYRNPHEPSHHWALRKRFMDDNKGRFPEEKLVCLAQVFANVEFMGCRCARHVHDIISHNIGNLHLDFVIFIRYPKETMDLVEDMSFGIVQQYREDQKKRLKRTFVSGSDAAGAKVNRGKAKTS